jgi:phosphatidylglycerophosphatase A
MNTTRRNDLIIFVATGCFSGFLPYMPGTWGTFAAIPLVMIVHKGEAAVQALAASLFFLAAVWTAGRAEVLLGRRDAGPIVVDEMCGFLVSLTWLPLTVWTLTLGFVFFRIFDIVKPPPIGNLERVLRGGWAVVMDDVAAGIFANVSIRMLLFLFSKT